MYLLSVELASVHQTPLLHISTNTHETSCRHQTMLPSVSRTKRGESRVTYHLSERQTFCNCNRTVLNHTRSAHDVTHSRIHGPSSCTALTLSRPLPSTTTATSAPPQLLPTAARAVLPLRQCSMHHCCARYPTVVAAVVAAATTAARFSYKHGRPRSTAAAGIVPRDIRSCPPPSSYRRRGGDAVRRKKPRRSRIYATAPYHVSIFKIPRSLSR